MYKELSWRIHVSSSYFNYVTHLQYTQYTTWTYLKQSYVEDYFSALTRVGQENQFSMVFPKKVSPWTTLTIRFWWLCSQYKELWECFQKPNWYWSYVIKCQNIHILPKSCLGTNFSVDNGTIDKICFGSLSSSHILYYVKIPWNLFGSKRYSLVKHGLRKIVLDIV